MRPPIERWRRWAVSGVGLLLCGIIVGMVTVSQPEWNTPHHLQIGIPLLLAIGLVAFGGWLVRSDLSSKRIRRIALWSVAGAVIVGSFATWEMYTHLLEGDPLVETFHELLLGLTEGAVVGGFVGYYDARRKDQYLEAERARQAVSASMDGIAILDENGVYEVVNQAHANVYGYDGPEAFNGETWQLCYTDAEAARIEAEIMPQLFEEGAWRGELTGQRRDGSTFPQELTLSVRPDGGLVCVVRDITERDRRERGIRALHEATRELMAAADESTIADITVRAARDVLDFPLVSVRYLNDDEDALVPVAITDRGRELLGEPEVFDDTESLAWEPLESGEPRHVPDVTEFEESVNAGTGVRSLIILPIGRYGTLNIASTEPDAFETADIALAWTLAANVEAALDRAADERELRHRERELRRQNARLDEFASVVSHDLRNPLNVARGRLQLAREEYDSEHHDAVMRALDRMETLIQDTLALARAGETVGEIEAVELPEIVDTCWRNVATESATLSTETDVTIHADKTRLQQLLENLLRNAVEHGGSEVTITVGDLPNGFYVEDDGPGIPLDTREKALQPGYSTAESGTGFGLSIVRDIAAAHGWEVSVTDGAEGGARFEFTGVESE